MVSDDELRAWLNDLVALRNKNPYVACMSPLVQCKYMNLTERIKQEAQSIRQRNVEDLLKSLNCDFASYKARTKDIELTSKLEGIKVAVMPFLDIYDDMSRMMRLMHADDYSDEDAVNAGFAIIFENVYKALQSLGLCKIECEVGMEFDVLTMEAIASEKANGDLVGKIVHVVKTGWTLNGEVLRHARVTIGM